MRRNRAATEARILDAVGRLLAEAGFQAIGINAMAKAAEVDKVLIYRYFGGLPELLTAFGEAGDFWWQVDDLIGEHLPGPEDDSPAGWVALTLRRHLEFLRTHPIAQAILAWETVEDNELTAWLAAIREERSRELAQRLAPRFAGRGDRRWRGVTALLGAACNYLVVRSATVDVYAGVPLQSEDGWRELEDAMDLIVYRVFGDAHAQVNTTRI